MKLNKSNFDFTKRIKLLKYYAVIGVAVGIATLSIGFSKKNGEYKNITKTYIEVQNDNNNNLTFYDELENYSNEAQNIQKYIEVAEELNDLKLDKYNLDYFDYSVDFLEPEKVFELIEKFKELKKEVDGKIGDDAIELNEIVYVLKEQEKMYNQKLYESYDVLDNYATYLSKSLIADKYGIYDPSSIIISYHYEKADGMYVGSFTSDNVKYKIDEKDEDILKIVANAQDMDNQNETDINKIQAFNEDRIKKLENTYNEINKLASNTIEDIQKENEKGNQK